MRRIYVSITCIACILVGLLIDRNMFPVDYLPATPQADSSFFALVLDGLSDYHAERERTITDWEIHADRNKGIIETGWFKDHKGEVHLRINIVVWDSSYRVDVWQRLLLFG